MTRKAIFAAVLVAAVQHISAQQLPYNPTSLFQHNDTVYVVSPSASNQFYQVDVSQTVGRSAAIQIETNILPFTSTNNSIAYLPLLGQDSLTVLAGDCSDPSQELGLWRYNLSHNPDSTWSQIQVNSGDSSLGANYLAAGFSFSATNSTNDESLFVFGGMCPFGNATASSWITDATYSNTMMTFANNDASMYQLSLTGQRAPPVAEAGLTITPLVPTFSSSTAEQQNFVLIGGHTQTAFLNMSQIALFSLPEQSWAFVDVAQSSGPAIEPRSGHTAVMTEDGSKIIVLGGWVGSVTNPASPQLAILNVGGGYGGQGQWTWTVPQQNSNPFATGQGIYGHGAVMLDGGVMMISGGNPIGPSPSKTKRSTANFQFYNTTSSTWIQSYTNPHLKASTSTASSSGMEGRQKIGLGVGLGVGIAAAVVAFAVLFFVLRRHKREKQQREREIRRMELGADRGSDGDLLATGMRSQNNPEMRSASTVIRHGLPVNDSPAVYPWTPVVAKRQGGLRQVDDTTGNQQNEIAEVPVPPTARRSVHSRGPAVPGSFPSNSTGLGIVFRIDEEEEEERSRQGSVKSPNPQAVRPLSDPFRDPPNVADTEPIDRDRAASQRKQEVATWMDDWQSAADSMNISRTPSKANSRTYSSLSAYQSSNGRSVSPDKSDRTGSNLSENSNRSNLSIRQSLVSSITGAVSQVGTTAGNALFAGASAAMTRISGRPTAVGYPATGLDRSASKRSVSHGDLSQLASRKRANSGAQQDLPPLAPATTQENDLRGYWTPPESPIKDYKQRSRTSSFTSAINRFGKSGKRILTGTNYVDVEGKVADIEYKEGLSGYNGVVRPSQMTQRSVSTGSQLRTSSMTSSFWQPKQGASGWHDSETLGPSSSSDIRRRSGRLSSGYPDLTQDDSRLSAAETENEDWDIESAVQKRVVQVMFTVPKEKLRVVNADALSLISRSDTNASRDSQEEREKEMLKRMSALTERDDEGDARTRRYSEVGSEGVYEDKGKGIERTESGQTIGKAI